MKIIYIDCSMGAAGDMLAASLLELTDDPDKTLDELNNLGIPGVVFEYEKVEKNGISGTRIRSKADSEKQDVHKHHHPGIHDIEHIIFNHINADDRIKEKIISVYSLIADAESRVHGVNVEQVRFHEIGSMDSIADIAAVCYLFDKINADRIIASPIHVGRGTVRCAHGILPVPAPATALILEDMPFYSREEVEGELCTPTGAALLKTFVSEFSEMPFMHILKTGCGLGTREFNVAGCLKTFLAESDDKV